MSEILEEKFRISKWPCDVLSVLYKHQLNPKPFHFRCERPHLLCNNSNGRLFTCEDKLIGHVIFTLENIVFSRESSLIFIS